MTGNRHGDTTKKQQDQKHGMHNRKSIPLKGEAIEQTRKGKLKTWKQEYHTCSEVHEEVRIEGADNKSVRGIVIYTIAVCQDTFLGEFGHPRQTRRP